MFRKRSEPPGRMSATGGAEHETSTEGRASATRNVEGGADPDVEGRSLATGGLEAVPRRAEAYGSPSGGLGSGSGAGLGSAYGGGRVGAEAVTLERIDRRLDEMERRIDRLAVGRAPGPGLTGRVAEIQDVTAARLGAAGVRIGEAARDAGDRVGEAARDAGERVREAIQEVEVEEFRLRGKVAGHPFGVDLQDEGADRFLNFEFTLRTDEGDQVRISGRKNVGDMLTASRGGGTSGGSSAEYAGTLATREPSELGDEERGGGP